MQTRDLVSDTFVQEANAAGAATLARRRATDGWSAPQAGLSGEDMEAVLAELGYGVLPGLERDLADHGVRAFCVDQSGREYLIRNVGLFLWRLVAEC